MSQHREPGFLTGISLLMPITLSVMAALFVAPIAPRIAEAYGPTGQYTAGELGFYIGAIITVPSLCVALFSIPAGWLGDRVGRRRMLIWSMAIYVAVGVLPFFLNDLKTILLSRVAVGVVEAALMTDTSHWMTLPMLRPIAALIEGGATVVGKARLGTPSLDQTQEYNRLIEKLWPGDNQAQIGKGRVIVGDAQPGATKLTTTALATYRADAPLQPAGLIGPVTLLGVGK